MTKITSRDFARFRAYVGEYMEKLGLKDWEIAFQQVDNDNCYVQTA
jgi:hypothetical protein